MCRRAATPLCGKQVPLTVKKDLWLALNHLPWQGADSTPAKHFEVTHLTRFFNREHMLAQAFFPWFERVSTARDVGGFWSNGATRCGYVFLSQAYGKVYVLRGKLPSTPHTWDGEPAPMHQDADMRYWSLCSTMSPPSGMTVDCVYDETVLPTLDAKGFFNIVISRAPDRPVNATEKCGVVWMEYGTGDGIPGGSPNHATIINRHTQVNANFKHSWFNVEKPKSEAAVMGEYLPNVINMHKKERFETLGCPVETGKLAAMTAK